MTHPALPIRPARNFRTFRTGIRRGLHAAGTLLFLAAALMPGRPPAAATAGAASAAHSPINTDAVWDGAAYLRIPVRLGSDTRLVMPEPFDDVWERESEVACTLLDGRTLIIRPRSAAIEQRLTMRGRKTGTLYLARVSSALPYTPIVTVHNFAPKPEGVAADPAQRTILVLLKAMMRAAPPPGTEVRPSSRLLLDQAPYRIEAREVWRWPSGITGVIAQIRTTAGSASVPIVPANIDIRIPRLGTLRAMGADDFLLDAAHPSTRAYLIYAD